MSHLGYMYTMISGLLITIQRHCFLVVLLYRVVYASHVNVDYVINANWTQIPILCRKGITIHNRQIKELRYVLKRETNLYPNGYYVMKVMFVGNLTDTLVSRTGSLGESAVDFYVGNTKILEVFDEEDLTPIFSHQDDIGIHCKLSAHVIFTVDMINTKSFHTKLSTVKKTRVHKGQSGYFTSPNYPFGFKAGTQIIEKIIDVKSTTKFVRINFVDLMFTSHGFVCSNRDDNIRIKGSRNPEDKFEYATDVHANQRFICGQPQLLLPSFHVDVRHFKYIFIQFNAVHSTIGHRGYAISYEILNDNIQQDESIRSAATGIVIATVACLIATLVFAIAVVVYYVLKRKRKNKTIQNSENAVQDGAVETRNTAIENGDNIDDESDNGGDNVNSDNSLDDLDVCSGGSGSGSRGGEGLNGLNLENLKRLNKMFSATVETDEGTTDT